MSSIRCRSNLLPAALSALQSDQAIARSDGTLALSRLRPLAPRETLKGQTLSQIGAGEDAHLLDSAAPTGCERQRAAVGRHHVFHATFEVAVPRNDGFQTM